MNSTLNISTNPKTITGPMANMGITLGPMTDQPPNFWFLFLLIMPILTVFGNALVVTVVLKERSLKSPTNFLLVSLGIADLLVGVGVMPFSLYEVVNNLRWNLPGIWCDVFNMMDVAASTASILNLVAVSIERFYAVVKNINYRGTKHGCRILVTILFVWLFSVGTGLCLQIGSGRTSDSAANQTQNCNINDMNYMFYASIFAFFIPCAVMILMYSIVYYHLHVRLRTIRMQEMAAGHMVSFNANINNVILAANGDESDVRRKTLAWALPFLRAIENSTEIDDDDVSSSDFAELTSIFQTLETDAQRRCLRRSIRRSIRAANRNGRRNISKTIGDLMSPDRDEQPPYRSTIRRISDYLNSGHSSTLPPRKTSPGSDVTSEMIKEGPPKGAKVVRLMSTDMSSEVSSFNGTLRRRTSSIRQTAIRSGRRIKALKERAIQILMKMRHKEGQNVRKETRATKLVSAVMGVFLACWFPFFVLNVMKSFKVPAGQWTSELELLFHIFTWFGYLNSCLNPLVYSLINNRFRQKFRKILGFPPRKRSSMRGPFNSQLSRKDEVHNLLASITFNVNNIQSAPNADQQRKQSIPFA